MFERDLRNYSRHELGWKFDSSGVRSVADGTWIDVEQGGEDLLAKERMVFDRLKLQWRDPTERCTD
jgi:DNA polymerase IV